MIRMSTLADKFTVLSNKRYLPFSIKVTEDLSLSSRIRKQEIWQRKFGSRFKYFYDIPNLDNTTFCLAEFADSLEVELNYVTRHLQNNSHPGKSNQESETINLVKLKLKWQSQSSSTVYFAL